MDIADSRRIAYGVHDALMDSYSEGLLVDHRFSDGRGYISWPDAESVLMGVNAIQDTVRLTEFVSRFSSIPYVYNSMPGMKLKGAKISYPHKRMSHMTEPPHPAMSDEELLQYEWPNTVVIGSYTAVLYLDIGSENKKFVPSQRPGEYEGVVINDERWVHLMNWPIMVGSNRCNMAVIRSHLDDPEYGNRARYILGDLTHCETSIPDGYFIINGRIKKVNSVDRLQMNTPYVLKIDDTAIIGGIICEIRSLEKDLGISTHNVHLISTVESKDIPKGVDTDTYKFYSSVISMVLERGSKVRHNIFDVIAGVGAAMGGVEVKESHSMLTDAISRMTQNDPDITRIVSLTYDGRKPFKDIRDAQRFADTNIALPNKDRDVDSTYLPHCRSLKSKVLMTAIMSINAILAVTKREPLTDMKDFTNKRFDTVGHRLSDYLRSMLQRNHDISGINKDMNNLISTLGQNKWPVAYRANKRKGLAKDEDAASAIVNDAPIFSNASILDSVRGIKIGAHNNGNTSSTRRVHTSQYFYQCPANTPENENIGLNNSLAEVCLISIDLTIEEKEELEAIVHHESYKGEGDILLVYDGQPLFYVKEALYWDLMNAYSSGNINQGVGIAIHNMWGNNLSLKVIVVRIAHGRPLAPLIKLPESMPEDEFTDMGQLSWDELSSMGMVVMADPYVVSCNIVIAPWLHNAVSHVEEGTVYFDTAFTHSAILPGDMLSQATNCLQYIEHDPAARGTYATLHIKQSISKTFLYPELRFDHESASITNPEPSLISTRTARRIGMTAHRSKYIPPSTHYKPGYGANLNICFASDFGNYDDAVHISQSVIDKNLLTGHYYDVFTSDQNISITASNTYNVVIVKMKNVRGEMEYMEIRGDDGIGLIDPDFSNSVITPYSHPDIIDVTDIGERIDIRDVDPRLTGHYLYQVEEGLLYTRYGFKRPLTYTYRDVSTGEITERTYVDLSITALPGLVITEPPKAGEIIHTMALSAIREDKVDDYDRTFISDIPFEWDSYQWYMSKSDMPVPKSAPQFPDKGMTVAIMRRRQVKRGDIAMKLIERTKDVISGIKKEKFSVTFGIIESVEKGSIVKMRIAMPILPEPGNKYASLHAQKSVCARVLQKNEVPRARWHNPITGEDEEMEIHLVFNGLSIPSRMTMGMEYEKYFLGTLTYMRDKGLLDIYMDDRDEFDEVMYDTYGFDDASSFIDELTDATPFVYDNMDKKERCSELRESLGIPADAMYDMYYVDDDKVTSRIEEKMSCGSVYYVALRHLVDNKRRARGFVGKRDPLTLQPVRGRKRDGGSSTGTMEADVYKAHGARAMLWERMNKVSDGKIVYKCDRCGSLVSRSGSGVSTTYRCMDEDAILPVSQVTEVSSVVSWELLRYYTRGLGIEITEYFG